MRSTSWIADLKWNYASQKDRRLFIKNQEDL